jgi:hypothetical protein
MSARDSDQQDYGISLVVPPGRPLGASPFARPLKLVVVLLSIVGGISLICEMIGL